MKFIKISKTNYKYINIKLKYHLNIKKLIKFRY